MKIAAGDWNLRVAPDRGGAILSLTHRGRDILRPTPDGTEDPLAMACFPMVPYANRIGSGRFDWQGRSYQLDRNYPGQEYPLHGTGWLARWETTESADAAVTMRLSHSADKAWPWDFTAEQRLVLTPDGLTIALSVRNSGAVAMPVSLGLHPYFAPADTLQFTAAELWLVDAGMLPVEQAAADALGDWTKGGSLSRPDLIDHCFTDWQGTATIARADGDIAIQAEGASCLHLYIPPGEDYFCLEPVTAMPDAVNHAAAQSLSPSAEKRMMLHIRTASQN